MAIFFALAVASIWRGRLWRRVAIVAACVAALLAAMAVSWLFFFQECDEEDAVAAMVGVYRSGQGFQGTDEYAPPGADNSLVAMGLPAACLVTDASTVLGQGAEGTIPEWEPGQGSCDAATYNAVPESWPRPKYLRIWATTPHAGYLVLRLRSYPAWLVRVNGRPVSDLPRREDGLMAVPVPQGFVDLTVDWTATPDVLLSRWLCALAVLALTCLWFLERRASRPGLS
jgi:hypothetical protein